MVLINTLSLTFLSFVIPLTTFHHFIPSSPSSQKLAILLEIFFLAWILLIISTIALNQYGLGGLYWITAWYLSAWLASLFGLAEAAERAMKGGEVGGKGELDLVGERPPTPVLEDADGIRRVRGVLYQIDEDPDEERADRHRDSEPVETEPTEITPLIRQRRRRSTGGREYIVGVDDDLILVDDTKGKGAGFDEIGWWILQYLALVPFPLILIFQILVLLLHSLSQTMVDGSSPVTGMCLFSRRAKSSRLLTWSCSLCCPFCPLRSLIHRTYAIRPQDSLFIHRNYLDCFRNVVGLLLDGFPVHTRSTTQSLLPAKIRARHCFTEDSFPAQYSSIPSPARCCCKRSCGNNISWSTGLCEQIGPP